MIKLKELLDLAPNQDEYLIHYDNTDIVSTNSDYFAKQRPDLEEREVKRVYGYNAEGYDGLEVLLNDSNGFIQSA